MPSKFFGSGRSGLGGYQQTPDAMPPASDDLDAMLAALEASGKLVCAWFLPSADPGQYLTLNGAAVEGWAAAYGTQKVNLAELTNPPAWDATLFGNKGGVVFDGTNDCLIGTGNVSNWPDNTSDLYMLAAVRQDADGASAGIRRAFSYGDSITSNRQVGRTVVGQNILGASAAATGVNGTSDLSGAHTIGVHYDIGGTSFPYFDGVADSAGTATATAALTRTRVRLGASAAATASQFWHGAIACAAILNSTATLQDFTDLEALMRGRLS